MTDDVPPTETGFGGDPMSDPRYGPKWTDPADYGSDDMLTILRRQYTAAASPSTPPPAPPPTWEEQVLRILRSIEYVLRALRPGHYTTREVGRLLGVSAGTVRRMIRAGQLRSVRLGPSGTRQVHRIPRAEIDRLFDSGRLTDLDVWRAEEEQARDGDCGAGESPAP